MYCFGDPAKMSDESVRLSLRIHDEVNPFYCKPALLLINISAMVVMSLDPIYVLVDLTSSSA